MSTDIAPTIVAVNGSERPFGNTTAVLGRVGEILAARGIALDVINLRELRMTPCGPCGDCNNRPTPCIVDDDVPAAVARMAAADGVIYATPVHGFSSSALMHAFIERAGVGYLRFSRPLTNKVAGIIAVGRRYSLVETHNQLVVNVLLNRMILVGSGFPSVVQGGNPGDALDDEEGMIMVERMVERMADMVHLLREYRRLTGREPLPTDVENERVDVPEPAWVGVP